MADQGCRAKKEKEYLEKRQLEIGCRFCEKLHLYGDEGFLRGVRREKFPIGYNTCSEVLMNEEKKTTAISEEELDSSPTVMITEETENNETIPVENITVEEPDGYEQTDADGESVDHSATLARMDEIAKEIQANLKTYKLTMWLIVIAIAVYLLLLFVFKSRGVLLVCIVMIILAVINTKYSRKIQKLAAERANLKKSLEQPQDVQVTAVIEKGLIKGTDNSSEAIVANAKSLNDLPKEYTVLDHVELEHGEAAHIVVSPYGIALVGDPALKEDIDALLYVEGLSSPIYVYDPDQDIAALAEAIQMEKIVELSEGECMKVCQKFLGLR